MTNMSMPDQLDIYVDDTPITNMAQFHLALHQ